MEEDRKGWKCTTKCEQDGKVYTLGGGEEVWKEDEKDVRKVKSDSKRNLYRITSSDGNFVVEKIDVEKSVEVAFR